MNNKLKKKVFFKNKKANFNIKPEYKKITYVLYIHIFLFVRFVCYGQRCLHLQVAPTSSKNTLRINQSLGSFRGGSLPNVSAGAPTTAPVASEKEDQKVGAIGFHTLVCLLILSLTLFSFAYRFLFRFCKYNYFSIFISIEFYYKQ